jgi:hypothetical protein
MRSRFPFPFRRDNRRRDGSWDAPDATEDNVKGTSVDPYDPVWPRWTKTPALHGEGEFISDDPFFDIDEITQTARLYPPGTPLTDKNVGGHPASRQRVRDDLTGNHWRRRLLVPRDGETVDLVRPTALAQQTTPVAQNSGRQGFPVPQSTQSGVSQSIKPMDITGRMNGRLLGRKYELGSPSEKGGVFIQVVEELNGTMYVRGKGESNFASGPYVEIPRGSQARADGDRRSVRRPIHAQSSRQDDDQRQYERSWTSLFSRGGNEAAAAERGFQSERKNEIADWRQTQQARPLRGPGGNAGGFGSFQHHLVRADAQILTHSMHHDDVVFSISANAADVDGPRPYRPMSIAARSEQIRSEIDNQARERLADDLVYDVKGIPPSMVDEEAIDQIISLLNDDSDAVRDNIAMALAAIGPRARKAAPALEHALELARQHMVFVAERNFIFSGFPLFTGPSSACAVCHALKEIAAPEPADCFNGYYDPIIETPPDQR